MDISQVCSAVNSANNTTLASKNNLTFSLNNNLVFNNTMEMSEKEKYWQTIAPNENHPFYTLGSYIRAGADFFINGMHSAKDYISSFSLFDSSSITVDDILSISSSSYMKQYCDNNETFKIQAQEKLESLIVNHSPDDEKSLNQIEVLLKAGIRTNHTLYSTTVEKRKVKLIGLLHAYDINIDSKDYNKILKSLSYCTPEDEIKYHCSDVHAFVKKITQTTTSSEEYEKIEKQIEDNYRSLLFELEEAIHLAKKNGKPLLMLIGEDHESLSGSLVNELILLDIISQKKLVNTIHTEDSLNLFKLTYFGSHTWGFQSSIEEKILQLGMKKKFIDLFRFNETEMAEYKAACQKFNSTACFALSSKFTNSSANEIAANMNNRNQAMAKSILETPKKDSVAIVGAHHIKGLIEDTKLSDHYYVAAFNTAPFSGWTFPANESNYDELDYAEIFLSTSEDVLNVPEVTMMNEQSGVFISADVLIEKTKAIHYAFNHKKMDNNYQPEKESMNLRQCPKTSLKRNGGQ